MVFEFTFEKAVRSLVLFGDQVHVYSTWTRGVRPATKHLLKKHVKEFQV